MKEFIVRDTETNKEKVVGTEADGLTYRTKKQNEAYKKQKKKKEDIVYFKQYSKKELGSFIFIIYKIYENINRHEEILTPSDLTRLIYIATFINYNGYLMTDNNKYIDKIILKSKLNLSSKAFNNLFNKLIDLEILTTPQKNLIKMNEDYFKKGKITEDDKIEKINGGWSQSRLFIQNVRHLYENTPARQHKLLSIIFRLIPYMNFRWNIICSNPLEQEIEKINSLNLTEIAILLNYDKRQIMNLKQELSKLKTIDDLSVITFVVNYETRIIINPRVIYQGSNYEDVKVIDYLCNPNSVKK